MIASVALVGAGAVVAAILAVLLRHARGLAAERSRGLARSEARYQELVEQVPAVVVLFRLQREAPGLLPVYVSPQSSNDHRPAHAEDWVAAAAALRRAHPRRRPAGCCR